MKKIFAVFLTAAMLLSLSACGGKEPAQSAGTQSAPASSAIEKAESQTERQPASSAASKAASESEAAYEPDSEETLEQAESGTVSELASNTAALAGGNSQGGAVLFPLEKKFQTKTNTSRQWYCFTTGEEQTYEVFLAPDDQYGDSMVFELYDEAGEKLSSLKTNSNGSVTLEEVQLSPKTTYYAAIQQGGRSNGILTFSVTPTMTEAASSEAASASSESETPEILELKGASAQGGATPFPLEQKVKAEANSSASSSSRCWFTFTTGKETDYEILLAPNGQYDTPIGFHIYNELGEELWGIDSNKDGSVTVSQIRLSPETTYYVTLTKTMYSTGFLTFRISTKSIEGASASEIEQEPEPAEELIFEEPFELNETQIMFVSNKAVFVDEDAAKAALEPVAEIILAHPDHPVLLAGTTATDGEQESCEVLSSQRAEAVKNLLVSAFGVPEEQLLTVGLGFEDDPFPRGKDRDGSGRFVESEAVKNRRVIVMDANDPTAQEILNK